LKFLLVCVLAVLMSLPAYTIFAFIYERTSRAQAVVQEVGQTFGGEQAFVGPILVAPYRAVRTVTGDQGRPVQQLETGWYTVFADTGSAEASVDTDVRTRGLFKVRTYSTAVDVAADFNLADEPSAAPENAVIDWSRAALLVGVTDTRSIAAPAELHINGQRVAPLQPGSAYLDVFSGAGVQPGPNSYRPDVSSVAPNPGGMQWMVAEVGDLARPGAHFSLNSRLQFSGVESLSLAPFARDTNLRIHGDWADVGYSGDFPSRQQAGAHDAFDARWSVPYVARNIAEAGTSVQVARATQMFVSTRFVDPSNPYQSVTRALKYAILFIGVVFLAYFLFEAMSPVRVHPAQYVLVGLAQVIFYLLLLAIAERIGFDWAFLIAATATVLLIGLYLGAVFKDKKRGYAGVAAFAALYALIYLLMRTEENALLIGSLAAFVAIAAAMYLTRNLDWYGLSAGAGLRGGSGDDPPRPPQA
jgi:inner membrane protein